MSILLIVLQTCKLGTSFFSLVNFTKKGNPVIKHHIADSEIHGTGLKIINIYPFIL